MAKRPALQLGELGDEPNVPPTLAAQTMPEPTTTIYARVPWSLGERLRDLARERSKIERRRVTVNELVAEAIRKLAI